MQIRFSSYIVCLIILISGCSHTYKVQPNTVSKVSEATLGKKGKITMTAGYSKLAKDIRVGQDSTSWIDADTGKRLTAPNSTVHRIVVKNHGKGAGEGLLIGVLSGAALGSLFLLGSEEDPQNELSKAFEDAVQTVQTTMFFNATIGGAVLGLIFGSVAGSTEIYILEIQEPLAATMNENR